MDDFSNKPLSAASTILDSGYAILRLDAATRDAVDAVFEAAPAFFDRPAADKARYARPDILEGYRTFGAEFSHSPDRPDLNETFSHVLRNADRPDVGVWAETNPLNAAMRAAAPLYAAMADGVLDGLRTAINPSGDRIASAEFSYFQLNYYRPSREDRDFLQDAHEDGHLLTIVTSRQPGLEVEIDGKWEPASLARDELFVMPGSIITLMTGGRVQPLQHRVRNIPNVERRASLMFFVNASVANPPRAWAPAADGSMPDIRQATIEASQVFGLQSIGALV